MENLYSLLKLQWKFEESADSHPLSCTHFSIRLQEVQPGLILYAYNTLYTT